MPSSPLDRLTVVRVADLVLHEAVEARRAAAVLAGMRRSGVLTDPVVAAPGPDGRWLVLDGAHRTTALAALGVPVAVVQRMDLDDVSAAGARVDAWTHDIHGLAPHALLDPPAPGGTAGGGARADGSGGSDDPGGSVVIATVAAGGRVVTVRSNEALGDRLAAMWALARRYEGSSYVRSQEGDAPPPGTTVRVSWTPVRPGDLLELAARGAEFPAGVSRFVLPGRLLGLRVPLADLRVAAPGGVPDETVVAALVRRLAELPVRLYREPVWIVETSQPG